MQNLVLDSSVIVKWLNAHNEQDVSIAEQIFIHAFKDNTLTIFAPELAKYEIGNTLAGKKKLTDPELFVALEFLYSLPIQFVKENQNLAQMTGQLAHANNLTYYDAAFVAVAREYNYPLITANPKHHKDVPGVKIINLSDYR